MKVIAMTIRGVCGAGSVPGQGVLLGLVLAVCLAASGCERAAPPPAGQRAASEPTRGQPLQPILNTRTHPQSGLLREHAVYRIPGPPADAVRTDRPLRESDAVYARALSQAKGARLELSACLSRAAEIYAGYHPHNVPVVPPRPVLESLMHGAGCPDSSAATRLYFTSEDGGAGFLEHLESVLEEPAMRDFTHVGVGRAPGYGDPYRWTWVVLLTRRKFKMETLPRSLPLGKQARLRFSLKEGLRNPEVLHMVPGGEVETVPVRPRAGGGFEADVLYGPKRGEVWIEVMAEGPLGPEVVMLFPVYAGQAPPEAWEGWLPRDESWISRPGEAERLMFDLVNQDRARYGLPELEWDEALSEVARGHSLDMAEHAFFAHTSPERGTLSDRLEMARYEARFSAENIARNPSVYDAEAGLMQSLGHRANILSPEATHLGVGVVELRREGRPATYVITQNFARPILRLSEAELRRYIAGEIERARRRARQPELDRDRVLDAIATDAAAYAVEQGFAGEAINTRIARALEREGVRFKRFRIQYHPILEPSDLDMPEALEGSALRSVGVGLARMTSDEGYAMSATLLLMLE